MCKISRNLNDSQTEAKFFRFAANDSEMLHNSECQWWLSCSAKKKKKIYLVVAGPVLKIVKNIRVRSQSSSKLINPPKNFEGLLWKSESMGAQCSRGAIITARYIPERIDFPTFIPVNHHLHTICYGTNVYHESYCFKWTVTHTHTHVALTNEQTKVNNKR